MSETENTQTNLDVNKKLVDVGGLKTFWGKTQEYIDKATGGGGGGGNISGDFATEEDIDEVCTYNYNGNKAYLSRDYGIIVEEDGNNAIKFAKTGEGYYDTTLFEITGEGDDISLNLTIIPEGLNNAQNCPCDTYIISPTAYNPTRLFSISFNINSTTKNEGDMCDTYVVFIPTSKLKGYTNDSGEYERFDIDFANTSGIIYHKIIKGDIGDNSDKKGDITYNFDNINGLDEYSSYFIGYRAYNDTGNADDSIAINNIQLSHVAVVDKPLSELITIINNTL